VHLNTNSREHCSEENTIAIIGAGLAGPAMAVLLARQGYSVEVYERRQDPRKAASKPGPSVNITLCTRGLQVIEALGAGDLVRQISSPAYGRVIHLPDSRLEYQAYGNNGEALQSVSRRELNCLILDCAQRQPGVTIQFQERLVAVDFSKGAILLENGRTGARRSRTAKVIIGADGTHSTLRTYFEGQVLVKRAEHANKELIIPAQSQADWMATRNALHIWPRDDYMLIAFPNHDGTTTCTLNLPWSGQPSVESISTEDALLCLFREAFPDVVHLLPDLGQQYFRMRAIPMTSVRCSSWSQNGKALLIGDAAHAFWPSYGQGANAAFEDCAVLDRCVARHRDDWRSILAEFEELRRPNTDVMTELSEEHFQELRHGVRNSDFFHRKRLERELSQAAPDVFMPLYNRISFTLLPYVEALRIERRQRPLVERLVMMKDAATMLSSAEFQALGGKGAPQTNEV
jgi:kynurenine 3-monooxygenase